MDFQETGRVPKSLLHQHIGHQICSKHNSQLNNRNTDTLMQSQEHLRPQGAEEMEVALLIKQKEYTESIAT